jgi:hypothetical protein
MKSTLDLTLEKLEGDARDLSVAIATLKALRTAKAAAAPKPRLVVEHA